jgi:hypothetical protein
MANTGPEVTVKTDYCGPEIITVGEVIAVTGAGGEKLVDSYGPDGHTATDWNKLNNPAPGEGEENDNT